MEFILVGIVIGLVVGGAASWIVRGARAKSEAAAQQAELREQLASARGELKNAADAEQILNDAKAQLSETFEATASRALQNSNEQFLNLVQQNLGTTLESAKREFDQRHLQFQELVKPLSENYGNLNPQIDALTAQVQSITAETAKLSGALTDNRQVGMWGEVQLRKVVEIAGMTAYCDFSEQAGSGAGAIPDLVVKLPEKRSVVVDAKASTAAYLDAYQADDDAASNAAWLKHANALKRQVDDLAGKNYGVRVEGSLNFVVMFVPGDQFLAAALSANPELVEYAMGKKVAIATPASLIAMLWAVANGWQQARFAESAQEIKAVGEDMHKRMMTFISRYQDVGRDLNKAVASFNRSVGSFDRNVAPQGRRFSGLVSGDEDKFQTPKSVAETPRISRYAKLQIGDAADD